MKRTLSRKKPKYHHMKANTFVYDQLEDDGFYYQLVEGVLEVAPSPITIHQRIILKLVDIILTFLKLKPLGELFVAPFDVELNDKNIFQPDLLFISNYRLPIITEKRVIGSPDLVVEVLSEGTKALDIGVKYRTYEECGVLEYWIIDPEKKSFIFYQLKDKQFQEIPVQKDYSSRVLNPLTVNTSQFWETVERSGA